MPLDATEQASIIAELNGLKADIDALIVAVGQGAVLKAMLKDMAFAEKAARITVTLAFEAAD